MTGDAATEDWGEADAAALWRILATRRDHRHFHPTSVPRETIERLLEVFAVAPSVRLSQPWHVTVVEDRSVREAIHARFLDVRAAEEPGGSTASDAGSTTLCVSRGSSRRR